MCRSRSVSDAVAQARSPSARASLSRCVVGHVAALSDPPRHRRSAALTVPQALSSKPARQATTPTTRDHCDDHEVQLTRPRRSTQVAPVQRIGQCDSRVGVEAHVVEVDAALLEEAARLGLGFGQSATGPAGPPDRRRRRAVLARPRRAYGASATTSSNVASSSSAIDSLKSASLARSALRGRLLTVDHRDHGDRRGRVAPVAPGGGLVASSSSTNRLVIEEGEVAQE